MDELVVEHLLGRCPGLADRGVAVDREDPVGVGLGDVLEADDLAVVGDLDGLVGGGQAQLAVQEAET